LRRHADAANTAVKRIGQGKIDDPRLATKMDGGLGALVGQFRQATAAPSRT